MTLEEVLKIKSGTDRAAALAGLGLITDGADHKQWYLERILEALGVDLMVLHEQMRAEDYDWEEGIAP